MSSRSCHYCESRLATEIHGAIRYSIVQHGDQVLAQQQRDGSVLETMLLATNQPRSVLQTLNANQPSQAVAYSPYGHCPPLDALLSLLGFNGERTDSVTGHYLLGNGYRAFNPIFMRFNSPDSLSPLGKGGINAYTYCLGDPINRSDQTGHFSSAITRRISAWVSRAKLAVRTKLQTSNPLTNLHKPPTLQEASINVIAQKTSVLGSQAVPAVNKEKIVERVGILNKANAVQFKPHSMQSRILERLANTRQLTTSPEATIGLMETAQIRYSLANELRSHLPADSPKIILSRIREEH